MHNFANLDSKHKNKKILVIVPHQDDEVIGMGGHVAHACHVAKSVHLVLVTDGAACSGVKKVKAAFDIQKDVEREKGFFSMGWGKQRDHEFLQCALTLGIPESNILLAYHDPKAPMHIKDGQIAENGLLFSSTQRMERYAKVAIYYFRYLKPDIVFTMAPYENTKPPNDHWAIANGVLKAAQESKINPIFYFHSGRNYKHIYRGGEPFGKRVKLTDNFWKKKIQALQQYMQWNPQEGWYATAYHSVPETFEAVLSGLGQCEYYSEKI